MPQAEVVLGLAFGDEGKGITTDFLCSQSLKNGLNPLVVRFSGGHQAGHAVKRDKIKHVFSSFGSGTLRGVPTYISEHCVINPRAMVYEYISLIREINTSLIKIIIHPLAKVSIAPDIAFNRTKELHNQHGSCGKGIGSTMKRSLTTPYKLHAIDLQNEDLFNYKYNLISDYYLQQLSGEESKIYFEFLEKEQFEEQAAINYLLKVIYPTIQDYSIIENEYDDLIFEGSQGIMLDMDHGYFPYVTYSNTTSKNAMEICSKLFISKINIYYVTRSYLTRHGNGYMPCDPEDLELVNTEEEINVTNKWQGEFKKYRLNYPLLDFSIKVDSAYSGNCNKNLVVTCVDQRPGFEFDYAMIKSTEFNRIYFSYSADSKDFKQQ